MHCAIYACASTSSKSLKTSWEPDDLWMHAAGQSWAPTGRQRVEDRRPSPDRLVADARRRRFDVLVVWRLIAWDGI